MESKTNVLVQHETAYDIIKLKIGLCIILIKTIISNTWNKTAIIFTTENWDIKSLNNVSQIIYQCYNDKNI